MGLKVYKSDQASKPYENQFFRELASNLKNDSFFQKHDCVLIGHPKNPIGNDNYRDTFKPDCLLLTKRRAIIIDFKNEGGELSLPAENDFYNGDWVINSERVVKGGNQSNPFRQAQRNTTLFSKIFDVEREYTSACVCFQQNITGDNVPSRFRGWFSIADCTDYVNVLRDFAEVNGNFAQHDCIDFDEIIERCQVDEFTDFLPVQVSTIHEEISRLTEENEQKQIDIKELQEQVALLQHAKHQEMEYREAQEKLKQEQIAQDALAKQLEIKQREYNKAVEQRRKAEAEQNKSAIDYKVIQEQKRIAEIDDRRAERERQERREKQHFRRVVAFWSTSIALIIAIAAVGFVAYREQQQQRLAAEQAEVDLKTGATCFESVNQLAKYRSEIESGDITKICYRFEVKYIFDNDTFVYLEDKKYPDTEFEILLSKSRFSKDDGYTYLHKNVEVHGQPSIHNGIYQIKVNNLDDLKVVE